MHIRGEFVVIRVVVLPARGGRAREQPEQVDASGVWRDGWGDVGLDCDS